MSGIDPFRPVNSHRCHVQIKASASVGTLLFLILSACQHQQSLPARWTPESIFGLSIERIYPTRIENYNFFDQDADGKRYVAATLGSKDGWVTGPILEWRIDDGRLWIGNERISTEFILLSRTEDRLIVENRNGSVSEFRIVSR
jgi:hypothetical protein